MELSQYVVAVPAIITASFTQSNMLILWFPIMDLSLFLTSFIISFMITMNNVKLSESPCRILCYLQLSRLFRSITLLSMSFFFNRSEILFLFTCRRRFLSLWNIYSLVCKIQLPFLLSVLYIMNDKYLLFFCHLNTVPFLVFYCYYQWCVVHQANASVIICCLPVSSCKYQ